MSPLTQTSIAPQVGGRRPFGGSQADGCPRPAIEGQTKDAAVAIQSAFLTRQRAQSCRQVHRGHGGHQAGAAIDRPDHGPVGPARPGFNESIDELIELAESTPTVILCAELEPGACHRATIIGAALDRQGVEVRHILGDGTVRHHEPPLPFS